MCSACPSRSIRAVRTPYKHDAFQPRYLVSESLDRTIADVLALDADRMMSLPLEG